MEPPSALPASAAPSLAEEFISMREADAAMAITRIRDEALDAELAGTAPARFV